MKNLARLFLRHIISATKNPLFAGSLIMVVGTNIHNFGQLFYHLLAIRLLSKVHYGDLAAIISIFGLLAIVQQSFGLTVIKFIASSKKGEEANHLARWVYFWSFWLGISAASLLFIFSSLLTQFLNIGQKEVIYWFIPSVFLSFLSNTGRALLQGFIKFFRYVISLIIEVGVKLIFTVVFLYLGYALFGAVVALFISVTAGFFVVWLSLRKNIQGLKGSMPAISPLIKYSLPVLAQGLAATSMYSADIILVKHFFHPETAGVYAALAKFGTIALFASSPVTSVMFPLVAKKYSHGQPYHKIFYLSILLVSAISLTVVLIYLFFNSLVVDILIGSRFLNDSYLLIWFGIYMFLLGMAMLFMQFYLSIGKTSMVWLFILAAILQVLLIWFIHPTLVSVIQLSIFAAALLVLSLLVYFPYHHR